MEPSRGACSRRRVVLMTSSSGALVYPLCLPSNPYGPHSSGLTDPRPRCPAPRTLLLGAETGTLDAMLGMAFGLLSALTWGSGDFIGGLTARRAHVLIVVVWAQVFGGLLAL